MGLGGPAVAGDIAVTRDAQNRVDIYTPDGVYKFGTAQFDTSSGDTIGVQPYSSSNAVVVTYG